MKNLMKMTSVFAITLNIIWLSMSFGIITPVLSVLVFMLSISLVFAIITMKNMTKTELEYLKNNKTIIQKISGYLSLFVFIIFIFGQLVFGWYLVLYYLMAFVLLYLTNPTLFKS